MNIIRLSARMAFLWFLLFTIVGYQNLLPGTRALAQDPVSQSNKKRYGVILALSGPVAPVGLSIRNAIMMAVQDTSAASKVEFLFEDDQFQAKNAVSAAEKLINQDKVDALITFSGSTSLAVSSVSSRRKIPQIAITPLAKLGESGEYVYRVFISTNQQIGLLTRAIQQKGLQRVAVITSSQDAVLSFRDMFVKTTSATVVANEEVVPGDMHLQSVATKMLSTKPDAFVLFLLPPQTSAFSKLLREQGFQGPFLGGPPLYNPPEIKASQGALVGALLAGPSSKQAKSFYERYENTYGEPCISEGLYGYDSAALLISLSGEPSLIDALKRLQSFEGVSGTYPKEAGNLFSVPGELRQITSNARLEPLQ